MTSFGTAGTGFTPLPNTMDRKDHQWTVDASALSEPINAFNHTVSAPTDLSDNARYQRAMVNARVALSHLRNPMSSSLPPWVYGIFTEATAISIAHYAHQDFPIEAMPWSPHGVQFNVNQRNWPAALLDYVRAHSNSVNITSDNYMTEFQYNCNQTEDTNPAVHRILVRAAQIVVETDVRNTNGCLSRNMQQVYELLQLLERPDLDGPIQIKDDNGQQVGDDIDFDAGDSTWTDLLLNSHPNTIGEDAWGHMSIEEPQRPHRIINDIYSHRRRTRLTDAGSVIRRPERMLTDGMTFAQRRNARDVVGAVLIDNSGSMSFSSEQVEELMLAAPGVIVAHYSGGGSGMLTIAAKDGKRVDTPDLEPRYGGNCVDGPALDWLGTQAGPRVWISDGWVTGQNCGMTTGLVNQAIEKCTNYNITRVPTLEQLLAWVASVNNSRRSH